MLTLFQRDDCHLCDMALAELAKARAPEFESVFLDDQPALEARYGARVPVLRDERGDRELDWPFDAAPVLAWLAVDGLGRPLAGNPAMPGDAGQRPALPDALPCPVMPASGRHYQTRFTSRRTSRSC